MTVKNTLLKTAVTAALGASLSCAPATAMAGEKEIKCYGVVKAGKNDCCTAKHMCAGMAKRDYDPKEWKMMTQKACQQARKKLKKIS